jgi:hypothetical protein
MNRKWESEKVRKWNAAPTSLLSLTHFPTCSFSLTLRESGRIVT